MPPRTGDDVVWIDVLPSLDRLVPELRRGLSGVAPQAGQQAGREFSDSFRQAAVSGVEKAGAQIAAARRKEADAAGTVRVAETKLQELRDSGRATASQLAAAEERLEKAKRGLQTQTDAVARGTRDLAAAQEQASRESRQLDRDLTRVGDSADQAGRKGSGFGSSISGAMKLAGGALIGSGLVSGFKSFYEAAAESAKIGRLTEQVITSTGGAAKVSADQVGELVTAISNKTGVDDEAIQTGANLLLTFTNVKNEAGKGNDIFTQTTQIMTDMSAALGTDASGSAIQLGKALNDPVKGVSALQKVGVSFTESQKDQIKTLVATGDTLGAQKIILAELNKEFGGAAQAASSPLDKLKVNLGNLQESIGSGLLPVVGAMADFAVNTALPALSSFGDGIKQVYDILARGDFTGGPFDEDSKFVDVLSNIRDGFEAIAGFVRDNITPVLAGAGAALAIFAGPTVIGAIASLAGIIGGALVGALGLLLSPVTLTLAAIGGIVAVFTAAYRESAPLRDAVEQLTSSFGVFLDVFRNTDAGGGIAGFFGRLKAGISAALPIVRDALLDMGRALVDWIEPRIGPALAAIGGWLAAIGDWVWNTAVPWLVGALVGLGEALVGWIGPRIVPALRAIGGWLAAIGDWIWTSGLPMLGRALADLGGALVDWIGPKIPGVLAAIGGFLGGVVDWIWNTGLPWLRDAFADLAVALVDWVTPQIPKLLSTLGSFLGSAVGWLVGTGLPLLVGGLLYLAYELISWVLPQLPGLVANLVKFMAGAVSWLLGTGLPTLAKGLFSMAGEAIKSFWQAIEQSPLFERVASIVTGIIDRFSKLTAGVAAIFTTVRDFVVGLWTGLRDTVVAIAQNVWDSIVQRFDRLKTAVVAIWTSLRNDVSAIWTSFRDGVVAIAQAVWDLVSGIFTRARDGWVRIFTAIRDTVVAIWTGFRDLIVGGAQALWDLVSGIFTRARDGWVRIFTGVRDTVVGVWTGFRDTVVSVAQNVWDWVSDRFTRMKDSVVRTFETIRDTVGRVWDGIQDKIKSPLRVAFQFVNSNMINPVNDILGKFPGNLKIPSLPALASGGLLRGPGTGTSDSILGVDPRSGAPTAAVSNGEFVVNAKQTRKHLGLISAINAGIGQFASGGVVGQAFGVPGYALGGLISGAKDLASAGLDKAKDAVSTVKNFATDMVTKGARKAAEFILNPLRDAAKGLIPGDKVPFSLLTSAIDRMVDGVLGKGDEADKQQASLSGGTFAGVGKSTPNGIGGLGPAAAAAREFVMRTFGIKNIGGYANRNIAGTGTKSDHALGKAIDVMIPNYKSPAGIALGNAVASHFVNNPRQFGTKYVIWRDQINSGNGWKPYGHPGGGRSDTLQHRDHDHISFFHRGGRVLADGRADIPAYLRADERVLTPPQDNMTQRLVEANRAMDRGLQPTSIAGVSVAGNLTITDNAEQFYRRAERSKRESLLALGIG